MKKFTHGFQALLFSIVMTIAMLCGSFDKVNAQDVDPISHNYTVIPAGSYVIAMDDALQTDPTTGLFNMYSYGLLATLLDNRISLDWVILSGKAKDSADFTANAKLVFPTTGTAQNYSFKAGPFIATVIDTFGFAAEVTAFNTTNSAHAVKVYQLTAATTVDVRYTLIERPKAAILEDGSNGPILTNYMSLAGMPAINYETLSTGALLPDSCFTFAAEPHNDDPVASVIDSIQNFVGYLGGNFFGECAAISHYENEGVGTGVTTPPTTPGPGRFMTTKGLTWYPEGSGLPTFSGANATPVCPHPDLAFTQYIGNFDLVPFENGADGESEVPMFSLATGSAFVANTQQCQRYGGADSIYIGQATVKLDTGVGHNIFYGGGHNYANTSDANSLRGMRCFFNAMFVPSNVSKCSFLVFDNDLAVTKTASPMTMHVGQNDTFTIIIKNLGPSEASATGVTLVDAIPTGFTYVSSIVKKGSYSTIVNTWTVGTMALNESDTLTLIATATVTGSITNTAFVNQEAFDFNQSNDTARVTVTVTGCPTVSAGTSSTICSGTAVTIGGSPTATGGGGSYTYTWAPTTGLSSSTIANPVATPTTTTTYTVSVNDADNCIVTASVTISVNPSPSVIASSGSSKYCSGTSISLTSTPSGGTTPYTTYLWAGPPAGSPYASSLQDPSIANSTTAMTGTYIVTVTDSKSCTASASVSITVNGTPVANPSDSNSQTYCLPVYNTITLGGSPTASGGSGHLGYVWSPTTDLSSSTVANPTITPVVAGTTKYKVVITDSTSGCSTSDSMTLTIYPAATVSISVADTNLCTGESAVLTASGSPTGGSYLWSPTVSMSPAAGNTATVTVDPAATQLYQVKYSSTQGCIVTANKTVNIYPTITSSAGNNQTYCLPVSGTITIGGSPTAAGGSGNYKYTWSPSSNLSSTTVANPTITTVAAGTIKYYVTVTDNVTLCSSVDSMTLTIFPTATVTISTTDTNLCTGQNTVLAATGSPTGGSYQWSPTIAMAPSAGNTASVTVAPSGSQAYQVIYTLNGCSGNASKTVNIYPSVVSSAGSNQSYCLPVTGAITIGGSPTASGGSGNYKYTWSPNYNLSSTTVSNPTITPVVAGTTKYYVTVTDNVTQCSSVDSVTLSIYPTATVSIASADTNLCIGGNTILTATGSPSGGTYQWSPTTGMSPVAGNVASVTVTPSSTQTYQVIYSLNGCSGNASKTVNIYPSVVASTGGSQTYCLPVSSSITLGGSPTASGGSGNYKYTWSPSTNLSSTSVANPTITSVVAGTTTYYLTVTDNVTQCTSVDSMTLTINPAVTANAGPSTYDSVCSGLSLTIGSSPTGSGGTGTLSYNWSPGSGLSATNVSNPSASPTSNTTYGLTVTDSKGCSATSSILVKVNSNPTANAGSGQNLASCSAAIITIGGTPTGSGGTGSLSYSWSPPVGLDSANVSNPTVSHLGANTTYTVTVTDSKGCTATSSMLVNIAPATLQVDAGNGGNYCAGSGGSVSLTGSVTGGGAPYRYQWSPSYGLSDTNQVSTTASPTLPGSYLYNFNVIDTNGCQASDTVRVTVYPYVVPSAGPNVPVCAGFSVTIGGSPTGSGGTGPLSYQWSPGTGLNSITIANPTASPSGNTTYALTVTDSVGCSATSSALVTVNADPIASAGNNQTFCQPVSGTVTLGGSPTGSGGSGSYSYTWSPSLNLNDSTLANPTVSPLVTNTEYYLTVTDKKTGCSSGVSVDSAHLTIYVQPSVSIATSDTSLCIGQGTMLTATGSPAGGSYQWSPVIGMTPVAGNTAAVTVEPSSTQTYQVVYTLNGCTNSADKTVNIYPSVVSSAGSNQTYCFPVSGTITIGGSPTASGGSGSYSYTWSPSTDLSSATVANPTITTAAAGTTKYYVTVTDNVTQCSSVDSMTLIINSTASVTISSTDTNLCSGQSTVLTAIGSPAGGTYSWSPTIGMTPVSGNVATVTVAPSNNQGYQVIYSLNGCSGSDAKTVNVYPSVLAHGGGNQTFCLPLSGTVTLGGSPTATGGSGHYEYLWTPATNLSDSAAANPTLSGVAENITYHLLVTDSVTGCTSTDTAQININSQVHVTIAAADTSLCLGQSATLIAIGTPGGGSYQWEPLIAVNPAFANKDTLTVTPNLGGQSYVVYYDRAGCRDSTSVLVTTYPQPVSSSGGNQTYCLPVSGTITLGGSPTASGGSGQFTYSWSPGTNLSDSTVANPTIVSDNTPATVTYTVTISDKVTGCTSQSVMTLTINPKAVVTINTTDTNLCLGQSTTLTASVTPAGGTYQWSPTIGMTPVSGNTATVTVAPTGSQAYQVVYNASGCYDTAYKTVDIYPVVIASAGGNQTYCLPASGPIILGGSPTAKGGSGHYGYIWTPGTNLTDSTGANPTVSAVAENITYHLTVIDSVTGCSSTDSAQININSQVHVVITSSDTSICSGQSTTLIATGTPGGGSYQWEPLVDVNPAFANKDTLIVTPNVGTQSYVVYYSLLGCRDSSFMVVTTYNSPIAQAGNNQSYCLPVSSPIVLGGAPTASGGSGHFSYSWSPGGNLNDSTIANPVILSDTTPSLTQYTVTITDSVTGCVAQSFTIISLNPHVDLSIASTDTNLCVGESTTLSGIASPTGGEYQWQPLVAMTPPSGSSLTVTVGPPATQTYQLIYGDNGCYDTVYQTVHIYPTVSAHAGGNQTYCLPVTSTIIRLGGSPTATGGSGSFTYAWSPSTGLTDSTFANPVVTTTTTTTVTYYLLVTDNVTKCTSTDSMVLTLNPKAIVTIASSDTNLCQGQCATLTATGIPSGGAYQWEPLVGLTPPAGNTAVISACPAGTQTYQMVYETKGCYDTAYQTIHIYPTVVAHAGGAGKYFCSPINTVTLGATPAATGGSGHYAYSWSPGTTLNDSLIANPIASPTATITYYLTVTDSVTGCTSVDSVLVTKNPGPAATITPSASICTGGSIFIAAGGGTSFIWSNGQALCCQVVKPDTTTTYTVTVTDANGCTASVSDTISVGTALNFTIKPLAFCDGGGGTLVPGLLGPNYSYAWSPGTGLSCVSCAEPAASPTTSTIYNLVITDTVNGCSGSDSVLVTVHPKPHAGFFATQVCQGDTVHFTDQSSSVDSIASWLYNFGDGSLTSDTSDLEDPTYVYTTSGSHDAYQVVTTIYGCADSVYNVVNSLPPVIVSVVPNDTIPYGGSVVLAASGGSSYSWSPASTLTNANTATPDASPDSTTTYYVTVTNSSGCMGYDSVRVVVLALPNVSAGPDTFVCVGNAVPLLGSSTTPGVTYQWSPATWLNNPDSAQPTVTPAAAGVYMYILTVTEKIGTINVTNRDTMMLTVDPVPQITANPDSVSVCGTPVDVTFSSSLASTTYTWYGSNGTSGSGNISTFINNTSTHDSIVIYTVVGTAPGGCTDTVRVPAVSHPVPILTASGFPTQMCSGTYYTGTVISNTPGTTITWTSTLGPNGTGGDINQLFNNAGIIPDTVIVSFTGTTSGGCVSDVLQDTVIVYPLPQANAGPNQTMVSCSADSVQLGGSPTASGGTPGYTYLWSPPHLGGINDTLSNPYVKQVGANATFTVTVTDSKGCTATSSMNLTVQPPTLAVSISASGPTTWCEGTSGTVDLTADISGGTPLYSFAWTPTTALTDSNGQVATVDPSSAGSYPYTVVVTDHNGCQASATRTIIVKPEPHPVITGLDSDYCANVGSVPLTASVPGGTWSGSGVVGSTFRPSFFGPGVYTVIYTVTTGGCTNDTFQTVTVDSLPVVTISGNSGNYCSAAPSVNFTGSPAGGTWSGPGINPATGVFNPAAITVSNGISQTVTVTYHYTSPAGCTDSASTSVTINESPTLSISLSADTICQDQTLTLTPHFNTSPLFTNIQWFTINGTFITNSINAVTVDPTLQVYGFYGVITTTQGCTASDTVYVHVNESPYAAADYDTLCGVTSSLINVLANDTDPENNAEVVSIVTGPHHGSASVDSNEILYDVAYGYFGYDTLSYRICNAQCLHDCDTANVYLSICPRNLPPTADTIVYTQLVTIPEGVNVSLATSDPNGDPLTISMVGDSTDGGNVTVVKNGNGSYTITGDSLGTFVITYQVCDTDQYPIHVLCDTSVIIAHIVPPGPDTLDQPPVANNDFATTSGTTPADVNVRGNDYSNPTSDGLTRPTLISSTTTTDGHWTVNGVGDVVFTPDAGLAPGIYYDTVDYQVCDPVDTLCATAYVVVTTNEIDTPIANRPPVAVDDYETVPENTTGSFNVKNNDSDPDGNPLTIPTIVIPPVDGTIVTVADNGTITYTPRPGTHSINGQPVDSFEYYICDSLAAHLPRPLCDSAEVYVYVVPKNLPPTADTIVYTQMDSIPEGINVSLSTSAPNGAPVTISIISNPDPGVIHITNTSPGAYTITGDSVATYVITYEVCDTGQYPPMQILCDTSVIIAHIIPPGPDTLNQPPVANNDFATTTGTTPAVVNVRGNDFSNPTSDGLTTPTLISSTTTADGTWSVDANGNVIFTPNAGLAPGIYYDTVHYQVCDPVDSKCATAYVVVTTDEVDTPVYNRPPVAVNDYETVPENTTSSFNVKNNDSDPDGNPLTIPTVVDSSVNGDIIAVEDNGTVIYRPNPGVHSINGQPVDSFKYYICDSLAAHPVSPLCDSAEVYVYVAPANLPPTADTIVYTQMDSIPEGINVSLSTSAPNGVPVTISIINNPDPGVIYITNTSPGAYTITGDDTGTYVITYEVCDTGQYPPLQILCDTSVIIAHIVPPGPDTLDQPPVANNDFATTTGTTPAVVNVRGNDFSNPTSDGLTIPVLLNNGTSVSSDTTADGTWTVNSNGNVVFIPNAGLAPGIYYDTLHYQVCDPVDSLCATAYVVVTTNEIDTPVFNRPPVAVDDYETVPENTTGSFNVKNNDSDPDGNPLTIPTIVDSSKNGDIISVSDNGTIVYKPNPDVHSINGQPVDSFKYYICDSLAAHPVHPLCDSAEVYIYVVPANLPPTADSIVYTQFDSVPEGINVSLSTSSPNGTPVTISIVNNPDPGVIIIDSTSPGAYVITGYDTGTYVITYQVCDTGQYPPMQVLCDTSVIIAHIITKTPNTIIPQPPVANNDFATTTGVIPAVVNVRGNDFSNPTSDGLTTPRLITSTTTADGTWFVNGNGNVVFTPNAGLAPGIYYDTVYYQVCDSVNPTLCATAYVVVTTNEIDTPIFNRPPVAVNDYETVPENTTGSFNVKNNDSDPDGNPLTIPTVIDSTVNGDIISVSDNGTVVYKPNPDVHSINGQPVDSFKYYICDSLAAHPVHPLCDSAEVYIYVTPSNLPPTADTIVYTQMDSVPEGINVSLSTSAPNGVPVTISIINNPDPGVINITNTSPGAYTITGDSIGTFVITYEVCDTGQYPPFQILCDTSVIIAHIIPPADTVNQPPVANNDFATTSGTTPAVVNVRGNDFSNPTSDGLTTPVLISSTTTAHGTWSVDSNGNVVFAPDSGLAPGIYYDTVHYQVCDPVDNLCATAYVVVTTDEVDTPIANRPPVAVDDYETVPANTPSSFNVKSNDSDPDGNPLTIPTIISGPSNGHIVSVGDNGTVVYVSDTDIHSQGPHIPVDSFKYYICDSLAAYPVSPLCDSAEVYIYIPQLIFAVNDTDTTGCSTPVVICVKHNDYSIGGDSFVVKGISIQPTHGTATLDSTTQCITYTPDGSGSRIDSFRYYDEDALGNTDSAWVYVNVVCCSIHAASDSLSINYGDSAYAYVLVNSTYNHSYPYTLTILNGSGPADGSAQVLNNDSILYAPTSGYCGPDQFKYILTDICGTDTGLVSINVKCDSNCHKPLAVNDTVAHGYVCADTINVLIRDTFGTGPMITVIKGPLYGSDTVISNEIVYIPDGTHPNTEDSLVYSLCNVCNKCDTAVVFINLSQYPCNVYYPIVNPVYDTICRNTMTTINVLAQDSDPNGETLYIKEVITGNHDTVSVQGDTLVLYTPVHNFTGIDTVTYEVCNTGTPNLCNTNHIYVDVLPCLPPPIVIDTLIYDTTTACTPKEFCIDSIDQAGTGHIVQFVGFCDSNSHGTVTLVSSDTIPADSSGSFCFIYTPTCDTTGGAAPFIGNDTICIVICDTGNDTVCTTTHVVVTVLPKPSVDSIWTHPLVTYICDTTDVIQVLDSDGFLPNPGNSQTGTRIYVYSVGAAAGQAPFSGTVSIGSGDSTVLYVPNAGFIGYDTFQYVITTNGSIQLFDTGIVYVYVCRPPTPIVVNDNPGCLDTSGYVDQPSTVNILGNDTLYPATDTMVVLIDTSDIHGNGTLVVNPNFTVTFTPDSGKRGSFTFTYQVVEFVGSVIGYSIDTASVCIDIVDTAAQCTFPNGFSPNNDGYNDVFNFPCQDLYPNGSMEIFNRWGDPIWQSKGPFNGWDGSNQQGHQVPDGTYYFVYKYNDGSGRTVARFVVVHR